MTQPELDAAEHLRMKLNTHGEKVLYVWDYFYITRVPAKGDDEAWRAIERATSRIRNSEADTHGSRAPDVRLRAARRTRASARLALRQIERLNERPEDWVIAALVDIETVADDLTKELSGGNELR